MLWYINPSKRKAHVRTGTWSVPSSSGRVKVVVNPPRGIRKGSKAARMYEHIKKSYRGSPRAKEIAARTVHAQRREKMAKKGKLKGKAKAAFLRRMAAGRREHGKKVAAKVVRRKRRKLWGAALAAHLKKTGKSRKVRKHRRKRRHVAAAKVVRRKRRKGGHMAKKRKGRKGKSRKRSLAAKKAARTRKRHKAARRAAARKAKHTKRHRTGIRSLGRARRTIKYQKKHGKKRAKSYMRRHHMRSNPKKKGWGLGSVKGTVGSVVGVVKAALPVAGGFYGSRLLRNLVSKVPVLGGLVDGLGQHAEPLKALLVVLGVHIGTKKVLTKYRSGLLMGAGLAAVDSLVKAYATGLPIIGPLLATGAYESNAGAVGEYVEAGEYVDTETDEALSAYEEAAAYEEELDGVSGPPEAKGRFSLVARRLGLLPIRKSPASTPVRAAYATAAVNELDPDEDYFTGVFAGGFLGDGRVA